jgi:exonuclease III
MSLNGLIFSHCCLSPIFLFCYFQEHWLSEGQLQLLGEIDANFLYAGVSGFDNSDVLTGRPYGGCAILWRSNLAAKINVISTNSKSMCIRVSTDTIRLLIINVYMPYENAGDSTTIFIDQLSVIAGVIDDNADCHVIVGGDFNVDLSRDWLHTGILRTFCIYRPLFRYGA